MGGKGEFAFSRPTEAARRDAAFKKVSSELHSVGTGRLGRGDTFDRIDADPIDHRVFPFR